MRQCILCPATVSAKHRLCYPCFRQYRNQMHEEWFLALVELQRVQETIDKREQYILDGRINADLHGVYIDSTVITKRSVGRPRTDYKLVEEVLRLYDESVENELCHGGKRLSVRMIEKAMNRRVKFLTIWKIIKQHRGNVIATEELV